MLSFSPAVNYVVGSSYSPAIATADFNNDGNLDLAATFGYSVAKLSVRLGNGAGGFGAAQEVTVGGDYPSSIAVADFNGDNHRDMVVTKGGEFSIMMGNGDGTFQSAVNTFAETPVLAVGHFNNDGNIDLVEAWQSWDMGRFYRVHLGNGQGGFASSLGYDPLLGGGGLATADLNNDGKNDVVNADGFVLLGNGNGTFLCDYGQQPPLSGGAAVATGDFTGDGNADLVAVGNDVLAVLRGRGDGGFLSPIHHNSANGTVHAAVATADFNADGHLDAVVTDIDAATVSVMLGNGDGTLRFGGAFASDTSPSAVVVGDFNGDGRPDVAAANGGSNNLSVLLNDGNWTTVPPAPTTISVGDATVTEGNIGTTNATFAVTLTRPAAAEVTVRYDLANITATAATDYVAGFGTVTIPAGQTSGTITVAIKNDRIPESTETFAINLSNPTNAPMSDAQAIGTIFDNEPQISINDVSKLEGNSGTSGIAFTVSLSSVYDEAVTLNYVTANGTARAGRDYLSRSGSVTFAPGEMTKTITVMVMGDRKWEANETFFVNLSAAANAGVTDSQGVATIVNDDGGRLRGTRDSFALAADMAIEEWMHPGRKRRDRQASFLGRS